MNKRIISVCAATLSLIMAVAIFTSCGDNKAQQAAPAPKIGVLTVSNENADLESAFPATLRGRQDIEVRPQVSGFITKVLVTEGQRVSAGQQMFILDQVTYVAAVNQAKASVKVAESQVSTAKLTANNKKMLLQKNIISEYEYQMAQNDLATAQAQLESAKSALVNAQKNLSYTVVVAPSNGVVGSIPNKIGALAGPTSTTPLTTVSDNSEIYAYFSLNEKQILELTNGGANTLEEAIKQMPEVSLRLADGSVYSQKGKISTISGVIDQSVGAASVRAAFANANGMLRSGGSANVLIPTIENNIIKIPQKATYEIQDKKFVFVLGDSNKVANRPIAISSINDGKTYIVTDGLKVGEKVVIEGVGTTVKDGMVIDPVENKEAEQQPAAQK